MRCPWSLSCPSVEPWPRRSDRLVARAVAGAQLVLDGLQLRLDLLPFGLTLRQHGIQAQAFFDTGFPVALLLYLL